MVKPITNFGKYLVLMSRVFSRPERFRMYFKQYVNEMVQLGINSIGIVLLISFFIGAVICIQIKLNRESVDAPIRGGIYHARNSAAGVFVFYHVFDPCGKGGVEHCFRNRDNARYPAD